MTNEPLTLEDNLFALLIGNQAGIMRGLALLLQEQGFNDAAESFRKLSTTNEAIKERLLTNRQGDDNG